MNVFNVQTTNKQKKNTEIASMENGEIVAHLLVIGQNNEMSKCIKMAMCPQIQLGRPRTKRL